MTDSSPRRRVRRTRRKPRLRWFVLVGTAALGLAAATLVVQAFSLRANLEAAARDAVALRDALTDERHGEAEAALADLQEHAASAAEVSDGPLWAGVGFLPVVGDDVRAVRDVAAVLDDLAAQGAPPLVRTAGDLSGETFTPRDGRLDLGALRGLRGPVTEASASFARGRERLADIHPPGLFAPLQGPVSEAQQTVATAADALSAAETALEVLPGMLGGDGRRNYLVTFENNAEARPTGGLPGAYAVLSARDGKLDVASQGAGAKIRFEEPVLPPLSAGEKHLWYPHLGTFFVDTNFTPDFPRTAQLMRTMLERQDGTEVDGVVSLDPVALSYLLEATGPVEVAGGISLTAENAVDLLLHDVYVRLPDPAAQDAFFAAVTREIFSAFTNGRGDAQGMLTALARAVTEERLRVHSFDKKEQAALAGTTIAGEWGDQPGESPEIGVFLSDVTASKMQYFLDYETGVRRTGCQDGAQTYEVHLKMRSTAPEDAAESLPPYVTGGGDGVKEGAQMLFVWLYAPQGGSIGEVEINGKEAGYRETVHSGRPVIETVTHLRAGQRLRVTVDVTAAPGQDGDTRVRVTPGIDRRDYGSVVPSMC